MKNQQHTEQQLIKRCLRGKRDAQKHLYQLHHGRLMTVCRRYARDDMEAEDFFQEGFIKIFKNLKSYRGEGSLYGWMKTIMIHNALRQIRKRIQFEEMTLAKEVHENNTGLDQLQAEDIIKAIQKLPEGYKMVFNLFHIEGYNHREIASLLNIEESTSRSQLTKAKKILRREVTRQENVIL